MKPEEFKKALADLGLNPTSAGRFFGVSRQQIYKLIDGHPIPPMMELLINILLSMSYEESKKWIGTP